ncbi:hypothetical protein OSTOST_22773, partial [Ostertagia ostertagi]
MLRGIHFTVSANASCTFELLVVCSYTVVLCFVIKNLLDRPSRITPAMSKASCGALESFRVVRVPSFAYFYESIQTLKSAGAWFVGTSDADSAPRYGKPLIELRDLEIRPEEKIVVVLGKFFLL